MYKIGILTFCKSINYGSVLQAWALQQALENNDYNVEIIDYTPEAYNAIYGLFVPPLGWKAIKYDIKRGILARAIIKQKMLFKKFRKYHMNLSYEKYTKDSNICNMLNNYDCVVCGSDQIWNVRARDCDKVFFLPTKSSTGKIAYAVSVNDTDFTEKICNDELRNCINDFSAISSREKSGARKIEQFINQNGRVQTVLDPTLLHDKEEYYSICSDRIIPQRYIFLYNVWSNGDAVNAAKYFSQKMQLPVYAALMRRDIKIIKKLEKEGIHVEIQHTAPEDFVSLIRYADYIVTDSFHGTAFSLIFEKKFVAINEVIKNQKKNDERIVAILDSLGLTDHYLTLQDLYEEKTIPNIDYKAIGSKKCELMANSNSWLVESIRKAIRKDEH